MIDQVDLIILGGGTEIFAASRAPKLGLKIVLFEDRKIGKVCLNRGGFTTKTLTSTVELFKNVKKASDKGIIGSISLN